MKVVLAAAKTAASVYKPPACSDLSLKAARSSIEGALLPRASIAHPWCLFGDADPATTSADGQAGGPAVGGDRSAAGPNRRS